jgi:hypothetical protein
MAEHNRAIEGTVAQQLLDEIVSYLPIFERPGYEFLIWGIGQVDYRELAGGGCESIVWGTRGISKTDGVLSVEARAFIDKVCELHHVMHSLGAYAPHQKGLAQKLWNDRELCETTDLAVLCYASYLQLRYRDRARGGAGALSWFESEGFLPLLRRIKELHTRFLWLAHGMERSSTTDRGSHNGRA